MTTERGRQAFLGKEKAAQEVQDLRNGIDRAQAKIDAIYDEHGSNVESEAELRRLQQQISKPILPIQKKRGGGS